MLSVVLILIIRGTQEAENLRIMIQGQPRQKVHKTASQPISGQHGMGLSSQVQERHKYDCGPDWHLLGPITKVTKAKSAEGVVQVVEHLPNKHEALS
jgi:hypothetical protein